MLEAAQEQLATIAGQKPNVRRARKSIAAVQAPRGHARRRRRDAARRARVRVPRPPDHRSRSRAIRDFRGLKPASFDGRGNYAHGHARADHLPRDRLRRHRPGPRPGRDHHDLRAAPTRRPTPSSSAFGMPFAARRTTRTSRPHPEEPDAWPRRPSACARRARAKYKTREYTRCRRCGRAARRVPQVRPVPDLPARDGPQRLHPRHDEEQLVSDGMSMTDPIADFLTRIRNGIRAAHETVDIPASQAQARDGPHPQGAGLHRRLRASRRRPRTARPSSSASSSSTPTTARSAISGLKRVSRPGQRTYVRHDRPAQGAGRHGDRDRLDVARAS